MKGPSHEVTAPEERMKGAGNHEGIFLATLQVAVQYKDVRRELMDVAVVVKTNGIPFWGGCTTHFRAYFSWDWDVHYGFLTPGHVTRGPTHQSNEA